MKQSLPVFSGSDVDLNRVSPILLIPYISHIIHKMAAHKLIPYWITVREVEEPNSKWDQLNIHDNEPKFPKANLADYFHSFLEDYEYREEKQDSNVYIDEEEQKTFTVDQSYEREGTTIEGVFKSGEWGRNADFWDIDQHTRIEDAREENHAEEIPYYFLFHIPDVDSHQALLVLSKYKKKGIKTLFSNLFRPRDRDMDVGDAYMQIQPHYSDEIIEKIEESDEIASVRFRGRDSIPARDKYADRQNIQRVNEDISGQMDVGTELKLTPKGNQGAFKRLVKSVANGDTSTDFDYARIENENFSSANVTVVEGESQLTFSLWKDMIQMRVDVDPEEYNLDIYGGYPTPNSLGVVARQLANDLMNEHNEKVDTESLIASNVGVPEEDQERKTASPPQD